MRPIVPISLQNFVILAQIMLEKFHTKPSEAAFSSFFAYVAGDVISAVVLDQIGSDVHVKFGDSRSNRSSDI